MKKFFTSICVLCAVFVAVGAFAATAPLPPTLVPAAHDRDAGAYGWQDRHAKILERNKTVKPDYVFIGDSITHHWGGEPGFSRPRGVDSWEKLFRGHVATNLGFGFDYVDNAYFRVQNGELDGIAPRVVLVNIGTNNLGHRGDSAEACAANTRALVSLIREKLPRAKILLLGIYPRREKELAGKIAAANRLLRKFADGNAVFYAEPGRVLLLKNGEPDPACFRDSVHPNAEGYRRLGEEISKSLAKIDPRYKAHKSPAK